MTAPRGRTEAWLVDDRWAKAYPLAERTTLGRSGESTVILRDPAVSRQHAEIVRETNAFVLRASGSSGTKVNGVPVASEHELHEGDVVEIAFTSLRFTLKAPTGELFVIRKDAATLLDRNEGPTRPTLHELHPITLVRRWRRWWHLAAGFLLLLLMLLVLLAPRVL